MPYRVVTASTPLWADHQRTLKKGLVLNGTEFKCDTVTFDGGQDMLKTRSVRYMRKGDGMTLIGYGWLEAKNCEVVAAPIPPADDEVAVAFLKQLRDALDVVLGEK